MCFTAAMALPTALINGSVWGQCDSIYASLAILALWLCLDEKPALSMAAAALSFAFKLQAIFLMPVFLLFLFSGRLRLRHLPVFPTVYLLAVSPALLAGRGFWETVSIYISTAETAGSALNYNSPSMYSLPFFYRTGDAAAAAAAAGVAAAAALCLIVFAAFFIRRRKIGRRSLFFAALFFSVSIPLLLPHMHDRYFYLCDALSLAAAFIEPACLLLPFFSQFASLLGYHAYFYMRYLLPMRHGFAPLVILAFAAAFFAAAELFDNKTHGVENG
jgi:Gpi18-like mannosyltransferase